MNKLLFKDHMSAYSHAKKKEFEEGETFKVKKVEGGLYQVVRRQKSTEKEKKEKKETINIIGLKRKMFGEMYANDEIIDLKIKEISRTRRPKNVDWKNTYCDEKSGNVRYASNSKKAIYGWAYIFTQDEDYVYDLSFNRKVQVKENGSWVSYQGYIPEEIETNAPDNIVAPDEWVEEYDY